MSEDNFEGSGSSASYPDFEDLPIQVDYWLTKGEYRKRVKRNTTIRELLDTWDIDDPSEDTEIAQVMRHLRTINKHCQTLQFMVDNGLGTEDMETDGYGDRSSIS